MWRKPWQECDRENVALFCIPVDVRVAGTFLRTISTGTLRPALNSMHLLRNLLIITVVTAVSCTGPAEEPMFVRGTNVRLRVEPSTDSAIVATLQGGTSVNSIGTTAAPETIGPWSGVWHEIKVTSGGADETTGWIFGAFLVPPGEGPAALLQSADNARSPGEAVRAYERLLAEFPAYNEHGLFETDLWASNRIVVNKCWEHKFAALQSDLDEHTVLARSVTAIQNRDAETLMALGSCDFILMEGGCAGDPLGGPMSRETAGRVIALATEVDWSQNENGCYALGDARVYCLSSWEAYDRHFLSFVCTREQSQ